jgi:hypothetical protein
MAFIAHILIRPAHESHKEGSRMFMKSFTAQTKQVQAILE